MGILQPLWNFKNLYPLKGILMGILHLKDFRLQPCLEVDEVHQRKGDTLLHLFGGSAGGRWLCLNGEWGSLAFAKPARFSWLNSAERKARLIIHSLRLDFNLLEKKQDIFNIFQHAKLKRQN